MLCACAAAAIAVGLWRVDLLGIRASAPLVRALGERGRVAVVHARSLLDVRASGTTLLAAQDFPALTQALSGRDSQAVVRALAAANLSALLIEPQDTATTLDSIEMQLGHSRPVPGLRCLFLDRTAMLYAADPVAALSESERSATGVVARALVGGARPPRLSSFPDPLRAVQPVEVMVLLRKAGRARLWRSARGNSIASALLTASMVARQRWQEREQAMGGSLDAILPQMDVEVALLGDDGTVGEDTAAYIDRVFLPIHGVAYERRGAWRYYLPDTTALEGKGRASVAYRKLFVEDGLPEESFARSELRLYRLIVQTLAVSKAIPRVDDGLAPVRSPDEIMKQAAP